jgi:DNA-binding transcriptional LysR family regulator
MEIFVRVVEAGSFSFAAHDLKIGQPTISKAIAGLGDRLGVRLLVRSTRQLTLTEAGIAFYERALRAITERSKPKQQRSASLVPRGGFGLLHPLPSCASIWCQKLSAFLGVHSKLQLELVMDDRPIDLVAENIDVAIRLWTLTIRR